MISFNQLGNLGRLGNQMFQYASLRGIAANRGFDFCIPPQSAFGVSDPNVKNSATNIYNTFNLNKYNQQIPNQKVVKESGYHFDKELFDSCEDGVDLFGYFQSEKYFKNIENDIREDFTFRDDVIKTCKEFIDDEINSDEIISIHVRRGDYLNLQSFHPVPSLEYYEFALNELPNAPVLIFSDDVNWCLNQELFSSERFFVSTSNSADYDMCLMTMCNYHIIANSSFSWWGAWLSNSKKVFAPKMWFGPSLPDHDTSDLYCNGWQIV